MAKTTFNNPERVDTLIGWAILIGAGGVLFFCLARNLFPYAAFFGDLIRDLVPPDWVGAKFLRAIATLAGWVVGTLALVAVQSAEAWPVLLGGSPKETRTDRWEQKMQVATTVATIGYGLDAFFCAKFWPVLKVSMEQFRFARMWQLVDLGNIGTTIVTLFGVALYVLLWRFVRRAM
jgi:hypothetical protein